MSDNWIVQNLNSALNTWNEKLAEIWTLLTQSPESFKGGTIWSVITGINGALTAIGYGLLVLFFFSRDRKDLWQLYRHEKAGTCPQSLYPVCTGTRRHHVWHGIDDRPVFHCTGDRVYYHGTVGDDKRGCDRAPGRDRGKDRISREAGIHSLVDRDTAWKPSDHSAVFYHDPYSIWKDVQAVYVYRHCTHPHFHLCGRAFPVGGKELYQVLCRVCLEGAIIALACIIFSVYSASPPAIGDTFLSAVTIVWNYVGELVFNLLVLVGAVKASDRIVKEMMGL